MRPVQRIRYALTVTVLLMAGSLSGCTNNADSAGPCATTAGPVPVSAAPASDAATPTSRDLATNPEVASGYRSGMTAVQTRGYAVSTANSHATRAACEILRAGGTAADALITAQTVLGLTEPQASGLGGGAFLLYYDAEDRTVQAYDGRETAPAAATENYLRWISDTDRSAPRPDARASGRSIGVPGVVRMLDLVHADHGRVPWPELFEPATTLADRGFEISPRLAAQIADSATDLARDPAAARYLLEPDRSPKSAGTVLTNPALSKTLGALATDGADAFYTGPIAEAIAEAAGSEAGGRTPGLLTTADLEAYRAVERDPLCTGYREHEICGMPGPSSGGTTVAATLGILENFDIPDLPPRRVDHNGGVLRAEAVHLIAEAERLAYADRDKYIADPDFVPPPGASPETLVEPRYLRERAGLIDRDRSMGTARPGEFAAAPRGSGPQQPEHGTSHISVVDAYGNAAAMTTTVESAFGSFHMVEGFLLNNQLTDFAADPLGTDGVPVANRVAPGKRPRSSMSPTLVFDGGDGTGRGEITHVVGSPGGSVIIQFVVKTLVGMLDWGLDPQQAVSAVAFGAANTPVTGVGGEHPSVDTRDDGADDPLVAGLRERGHQVSVAPQTSGLSVLVRDGDAGWVGGADPRREGEVLGDPR